MGLFSNASQNVPVQLVGQLRAQSRSDHEIIDELSRQGYSSIDIYNALNQADQGSQQTQPAQAQQSPQYPEQPQFAEQAPQQSPQQPQSVSEPPAQFAEQPAAQYSEQPSNDPWASQNAPQWSEPAPSQSYPAQMNSQPDTPEAPAQAPIIPAAPSRPPQEPPAPIFNDAPKRAPARQASTFGSDATIDQIDQIAEAIIDEKWKEMKLYIEKIVDWKGKVENRILAVEENQKTLNAQIIGLQKSLLDKVQTYDRHITDVGTEIKAMEKVFQKIIPSLTENVNELSSVVHRMKDDQ